MASRAAQQDSFIEEEEESCPLCVEEFDLSDKNFKPCPCGFQICQFCFNKIRNTGSGLCPACRRPYDDKSIQWKVVSPEELKAESQKQNKKKEEQKRKEAQKREFESLNRKHLAGLRVVQKNLVYVVGLNPTLRDDELHSTLRDERYFGQYGKIHKIVVSKPKDSTRSDQSLGVYVTFERKEDAERCIKAVDGSKNGDRTLKAQFGTTKYCQAYLRNETCLNKSCMFLHEAGEDKDSFTREDLSSKNVESAHGANSSAQGRSAQTQPASQKPPAQAPPSTATEARRPSRDSGTTTGEEDSSALPSSASWANKNAPPQNPPSVSDSNSTSGQKSNQPASQPQSPPGIPAVNDQPKTGISKMIHECCKDINTSRPYKFDWSCFSDEDRKVIQAYTPMIMKNGGARLLAARAVEAEKLSKEQELAKASSQDVGDEHLGAGSLQLGGEPDHPGHDREPLDQRQALQQSSTLGNFNPQLSSLTNNLANIGINGRALTSLQQQQLLQRNSSTAQSSAFDHFSSGLGTPYGQASQGYSGGFQSQSQAHHGRGHSRYSFANDSATSTTNVKPAANPKAMAQQASMMPPSSGPGLTLHTSGQGFSSGVPGPPPGLKATGTPPISGGGMFGQGHGFTSNIPRTVNPNDKDSQSDMLRDLLRGRNGGTTAGLSQADSGKRELFPSSSSAFGVPFPSSSPSSFLPSQSPYGLLAQGQAQTPSFSPSPDFGPFKQKRRGKKHRHANTSSSGGSGIVDLADPTILQAQARMQQQQQQQQNQANSGQSMYGAGGQGQQQGGYSASPYGNGFTSRW